MSYLNTTRLADTGGYKCVSISADQDIRANPASWERDQYAEMVRVVLEWEVQALSSLEIVSGLYSVDTINDVYFQGSGPITLDTPDGFGPFFMVRQNIDAVDIGGSQFMRITEEYVTRKIVGGGEDDAGDPSWTDFSWGGN